MKHLALIFCTAIMLSGCAAENKPAGTVDALRDHIAACWKLPHGICPEDQFPCTPDLPKTHVNVVVALTREGTIQSAALDKADARLAAQNSAYARFSQSALGALKACEPFDFLPPEKYELWKDLVLTFDPSTTRNQAIQSDKGKNPPL